MSNDLAPAALFRAAAPPPPSSTAAPDRVDVVRSPGLAAFRLNAFRVLRLEVSAASNQAVWKSEKILARRRAGLDDPDPEIIGWLPLPDEIDVREAAQRIEEPLRRLRDQLLWFDFEGDPRGEALRAALVGDDSRALFAYLESGDLQPAGAPEGDGDGDEADYEAAARKRQMPLIAHRLNQANARLLLAFSWLHDTGPAPPPGSAGAASEAPRIAFKTAGALATSKDAHALFPAAVPEGRAAAWPGMLRDALTRWGDLLKNPWLSSYVESAITALEDDLVTSDDVEPLTNAVATALADAVVGEMKLLMLAGGIDRVLQLVGIATESGIDPTHWTVAFRPVRALFRAELDDLGTLIDPGKPANVREIDLYLQRVRALGATWSKVDTGEAFGLDQMIDGAVSQAIDRVRSIENAAVVLDRIEDVLSEAAKIATSPSTSERAKELLRNVGSHRESLCNFCGKQMATAASSGVLRGKKEISREPIFNGVRITYATTAALVLRCEPCAELHHYFRRVRNVIIVLAVIVVPLGWILFEPDGSTGFIWAVIVGVGAYVAFTIVARRLTPGGERLYSSYQGSKAYQHLMSEGFGVESYDYGRDAGRRLLGDRAG